MRAGWNAALSQMVTPSNGGTLSVRWAESRLRAINEGSVRERPAGLHRAVSCIYLMLSH